MAIDAYADAVARIGAEGAVGGEHEQRDPDGDRAPNEACAAPCAVGGGEKLEVERAQILERRHLVALVLAEQRIARAAEPRPIPCGVLQPIACGARLELLLEPGA